MNTPRSIDDVMNELNDLAKAQGKYLGKAFWETPRQPGSILDVPETAESRERIARLRARRLERAKTEQPTPQSVQEIQHDTADAAQRQLLEEKAQAS